MKTLNWGLTPFLIALAIGCGAANASTEDDKAPPTAKSEETQTKSEEAQPKREKKMMMDTDTCRRDAKGMQGPGRARFMTECIKKRD